MYHAAAVRQSRDQNPSANGVPLWTETACRFPPKPPAGLNRNRLSETPKFASQAARDLFKPKLQTTRADVPNDDSSAEYQPRRQPRIFAIPPVVPMSTTKVEPAAEPKQIRRKPHDKRGK